MPAITVIDIARIDIVKSGVNGVMSAITNGAMERREYAGTTVGNRLQVDVELR